ncbi:MAG: sigma-70 family RNA polymerase sigma factor, partial [Polyangiaceae bacterium]|nr:sigma-70 family RNA polymerase sigma factor [Polyangiaceae bacterium]
MTSESRDKLEAQIRRLVLRGDIEAATTNALRGYGGEIYGFLLAFHRREDDAADVFSIFSERVWKGIATFDWASSFRTWAYTIARNASLTYRSNATKRAKRFEPLPEGSIIEEIAEEIRSQTRSYLKTELKEQVARLRESLS